MHPLFIGGSGRSGTTLLVDMIGCHPQIAPIYEPAFLYDIACQIFLLQDRPPAERLRNVRAIVEEFARQLDDIPHAKREYERFLHGAHYLRFTRATLLAETNRLCDRLLRETVLPVFRDFILALFAEHAAIDRKPFWAAKVPRFVIMAPLLKQAFPEMRFIHCVRDPRAVLASVATRPWGPQTLEERIEYWRVRIDCGRRFAEKFPADCLTVRYEDLLPRTAETLSRVFAWLGVEDVSAQLVADYERQIPIDRDRAAAEAAIPPADRMAIEAALADRMAHYGYG